jgi:hypothetical protein
MKHFKADGIQRMEKKGRRKMFFHKDKKKTVKLVYDRENKKPAVRASICTGEQVAGFRDVHSGKFEEVMLLRNENDLEDFKDTYGIDGEVETFY